MRMRMPVQVHAQIVTLSTLSFSIFLFRSLARSLSRTHAHSLTHASTHDTWHTRRDTTRSGCSVT